MADSDPPLWQTSAMAGFPLLGRAGGISRPEEHLSLMTWPVTGAMVLSVGGELDVATMPQLVERVRALVEQGHVRIVLDLGHLEFCDCTGLRALLRAREIAAEAGGWTRLSRVGAMTRHIIGLTGLREALACYGSAAEAVAAH